MGAAVVRHGRYGSKALLAKNGAKCVKKSEIDVRLCPDWVEGLL